MTNKEKMAILDIIEFEEDWLSLVDLTEENVKMAFKGIKAVVLDESFRAAVLDRLDKVEVRPLENEDK